MIKQISLLPIKIKNLNIKTKIFLAPINTGYCIDGNPCGRFIEFHKTISGNNIGITYVGNVAIGKEYITNNRTAYFNDNEVAWKEVVKGINMSGGIAGIQLGCRYSSIIPEINMSISNVIKEEYLFKAKREISDMSINEIEKIIKMYIQCAVRAYNLGFKVIQIHAAHGYFLSLMLSNKLNKRKDVYGIDRLKVVRDIISGIYEKIPEAVLDIRLSLIEGIESEEKELQYKKEIIDEIQKMKISIISLSNGIYNIDKRMIYPSKSILYDTMLKYGEYFAGKYPDMVWNVAGNMEQAIFEKKDKFNNLTYSIARQLLSDPKTFYKYDNNISEVIKCKACDRCHYYSIGESELNWCINLDRN